MIVSELIELLQDMDPGAEVRLAMQPSWPFEYSIGDVQEVEIESDELLEVEEQIEVLRGLLANPNLEQDERYELEADLQDWQDQRDELLEEPECIVYLAESQQIGYLPTAVARELGWK